MEAPEKETLHNPLRYWNDRPDYLAEMDQRDAEMDREDSLSDRYAFQLGQDLARHGLSIDPNTTCTEMVRGFEHGKRQPSRTADVYLRKLLTLRKNAYHRGIAVSSVLTKEYLKSITVTVCPVSGVNLTQGTMTDTDWSVDRLNNQLGYVPGNLCIMSARVNRLKDADDVTSIGMQGAYNWLILGGGEGLYQEVGSGLLAIEAMRLTSLMQGPSHMRSGGLVRFPPYAMAPSAWTTLDGAIAGIHVECARSRVDEGYPYRRRRDLFKHLGKEHWSKSNRLVSLLRKMLANGKHPADVWFDDTPLDMLLELTEEFLSNPRPVDGAVDLEAVRQRVQTGIDPLAQFAR
ncbi:hypothetical protein [Paracidovorax sp. MALMAid1276]|uniref:hypothetical protein n=1 Tax=Paracidovorax sp. MALMAid1276 TaxID=3411631 RepID=UPI003B9A7503